MEIDLFILSYWACIMLFAGFVRGYSGFGASMIIVIGLSFIFPLEQIVPVILLLEVLASSYLLPGIYRQIDWSSLKLLLAGVAIGTPFGVFLLTSIPDRIMRFAVAVVVMLLILLLWRGFSLKRMPGKSLTVFTGSVSGVINGSAAIGGPPVILFYFSSPRGTQVSRASLIAFFLVTDIFASGVCAFNGLVSLKTLHMAAASSIPLVVGLSLGTRSFIKTDPVVFRKRVLLILFLMSAATLSRSLINF